MTGGLGEEGFEQDDSTTSVALKYYSYWSLVQQVPSNKHDD